MYNVRHHTMNKNEYRHYQLSKILNEYLVDLVLKLQGGKRTDNSYTPLHTVA